MQCEEIEDRMGEREGETGRHVLVFFGFSSKPGQEYHLKLNNTQIPVRTGSTTGTIPVLYNSIDTAGNYQLKARKERFW